MEAYGIRMKNIPDVKSCANECEEEGNAETHAELWGLQRVHAMVHTELIQLRDELYVDTGLFIKATNRLICPGPRIRSTD